MSPVRRPPLLVLLSPTTLLLMLVLGTAPHTLATQLQGDIEADVRLMLDMVRRHLETAGTVLEDVKLLTMSVEQMTQRMDALETTVTQRMDRCEDISADQTEKIEDEIRKQMRKLEDKIENQTEKIYMFENNVTRLLEPLVTDVNEFSKRSLPMDCSYIAAGENSGSGTYDIFPDLEAMHVYCDIEGSEGWTVLQRRVNGPQDFDKDWAEYKKGFGDLEGEHWVGNENMHILTSRRDYMIQIVLEGCDKIGDVLVANYSRFSVGSEGSGYRLAVDGFSGNATDGMNGCTSNRNHNGRKFTTKDRNNSQSSVNPAQTYPGAWWFPSSGYCTQPNRQGYEVGVVFWGNNNMKCKKTKMRIKPLTS